MATGLAVQYQGGVVAYFQRFKTCGSHAQETVFPFTLYLLGKRVVLVKYRGAYQFGTVAAQVLDSADGTCCSLIVPAVHPQQYRVALELLQVYTVGQYARAV